MTHIAVQEELNGKVVDWMEKVTDSKAEAFERQRATLSGRSLLPKLPFNRVLNATGERSARAGSKGTH